MDNKIIADYESGIAEINGRISQLKREQKNMNSATSGYSKLAARISDLHSIRGDMVYSLHRLKQYF